MANRERLPIDVLKEYVALRLRNDPQDPLEGAHSDHPTVVITALLLDDCFKAVNRAAQLPYAFMWLETEKHALYEVCYGPRERRPKR